MLTKDKNKAMFFMKILTLSKCREPPPSPIFRYPARRTPFEKENK